MEIMAKGSWSLVRELPNARKRRRYDPGDGDG
jgi:hypothetical protein